MYEFGDVKIKGRDNLIDALKQDEALIAGLVESVRESLRPENVVADESELPDTGSSDDDDLGIDFDAD